MGDSNIPKWGPVAIHNETSEFLASPKEDGNLVFWLPRCPAISTGAEDSRSCEILTGRCPSSLVGNLQVEQTHKQFAEWKKNQKNTNQKPNPNLPQDVANDTAQQFE